MKNYWVEKVKKNRSGNWVIRAKNKHTGKQVQRSFDKNEFTKGEVKEIRKQIIAKDTHRNQDDYEYDPFDYITENYDFKLSKASELFLENCKEKGLANNTLRFRKTVLNKFMEVCGKTRLINTIKEKDVKNFVNGSCSTVNSKNQYASTLRQFFKFLTEEYQIKTKFEFPSFGTKRQRKKENAKNPTIISEQELWELYEDGLTRFPEDGKRKNYIDLQCLPIYFYTGMRKEELPHIKVRDVNLDSDVPTITIGKNKLTKTYKERKIWIPEQCHDQIKIMLEDKSPGDYLIDHDRSSSINRLMRSTSYVFNICYKKTFPKKENMSLHNLRHSCGCWLLEQGFSMMFVKDQLGHANLDKTLIYARMTARGFQKEVNRYKQEKGKN